MSINFYMQIDFKLRKDALKQTKLFYGSSAQADCYTIIVKKYSKLITGCLPDLENFENGALCSKFPLKTLKKEKYFRV